MVNSEKDEGIRNFLAVSRFYLRHYDLGESGQGALPTVFTRGRGQSSATTRSEWGQARSAEPAV